MFGFLLSFCSIANAETYNLQNKTIDSDLNDVVRYNDHEYGIWERLTVLNSPEFFQSYYNRCKENNSSISRCRTYIKDGKEENLFVVLKALTKVNVVARSSCTLSLVYYTAQGTQLYTEDSPDGKCEYTPIVPGTNDGEILKFIMNNKVKIDKLNKYGK
ncbi:MAG: hypothetical protein K2Y14_14055 [Burkholderiales bacterium]|nr:hypothetical protein [Burkholderiales bacterium]